MAVLGLRRLLGSERERLGTEAELEDDFRAVGFQRGQECLVDVRGVKVPLRGAGPIPPPGAAATISSSVTGR